MPHLGEVAYRQGQMDFRTVCDGLAFPEGPVSLGDGRVLVVEIRGQTLTAIHSNGEKQVIAALEGGPNGAAIGPDGRCYVCNSGGWEHASVDGQYVVSGQSNKNGWIEAIDIGTGTVTRLYDSCGATPLRAPNDLVFDAYGGFYFTDHGKAGLYERDLTAIYYAKTDGRDVREVTRPLLSPNGIGLSPSGNLLYVAETQTRRLLRFRVVAPGEIEPVPFPGPRHGGELLAGLPDGYLLDSLAVDSAGHVLIGSIGWGGIWDISPDGNERTFYPVDDRYCTNICFDSTKADIGYATLSGTGRLVTFSWMRDGLPLAF